MIGPEAILSAGREKNGPEHDEIAGVDTIALAMYARDYGHKMAPLAKGYPLAPSIAAAFAHGFMAGVKAGREAERSGQ